MDMPAGVWQMHMVCKVRACAQCVCVQVCKRNTQERVGEMSCSIQKDISTSLGVGEVGEGNTHCKLRWEMLNASQGSSPLLELSVQSEEVEDPCLMQVR